MKRYRINGIKTRIDEDFSVVKKKICTKLGIREEQILGIEIRRKSIDARFKPDIFYVYTVDFWTEKKIKNLEEIQESKTEFAEITSGTEQLIGRPVVVGMGPCGIFAALMLAKSGYKPLLIDRGPAMTDRIAAVNRFRTQHILDPEANMLFGEGGAGTFSDGKLTTGIRDDNIRLVLKTFSDAGAGDEIMYLAKPHIGTDVLSEVIVNLRKETEKFGGEIRFNSKLEKININNGTLQSVEISDTKNPESSCEIIETNALVLAIGHSARDTFELIRSCGLNMEQKNFSIGVRIEHPQELIDRAQYGDKAIAKYGDKLPPADYKLSYHASNGRGVYSFCMCPGGEVVVCTTTEGELSVNGMSNRKRDSGTANSGILCDVRNTDYNNGDETDVMAGVRFQQKYERLAYENGGKNFMPPRANMKDFLENNSQQIDRSLPDFAVSAIREAIPAFSRKINDYDNPNAVLTAVETRSSSPIRILRDERGESNIRGIYPAGEGAGYAGGITSAACDGLKIARHIIERFAKK